MKTNVDKRDSLFQAVMQGRLDFYQSCSAHSPFPGGYFKTIGDSVYYASGIDYAPCNGIMEEDSNRNLTDVEIDRGIAFFKERNLPFIWWSGSKNLESKGFQFAGALTGVALDLSQGVPAKPSSKCRVKKVETAEELTLFSKLAIQEFGMSNGSLKPFQEACAAAMEHDEQVHFIAFVNDVVVAITSLCVSSITAGIWNSATLPEYRNQGIGSALVHAAIVEANSRSHDHVIGILMPKGMAWGLASKFGFKEICQFPFYIYGVSADELEK